MSAIRARVSWYSASLRPNTWRAFARPSASSSARRAEPGGGGGGVGGDTAGVGRAGFEARAGGGLGHAERRDLLAPRDARQPAALLLRRAVEADRAGAEALHDEGEVGEAVG